MARFGARWSPSVMPALRRLSFFVMGASGSLPSLYTTPLPGLRRLRLTARAGPCPPLRGRSCELRCPACGRVRALSRRRKLASLWLAVRAAGHGAGRRGRAVRLRALRDGVDALALEGDRDAGRDLGGGRRGDQPGAPRRGARRGARPRARRVRAGRAQLLAGLARVDSRLRRARAVRRARRPHAGRRRARPRWPTASPRSTRSTSRSSSASTWCAARSRRSGAAAAAA